MTTAPKNGTAAVYKWIAGISVGVLQIVLLSGAGLFFAHTQATGHSGTQGDLKAIIVRLDRIEGLQLALLKTLTPDNAAKLLKNAEKLP